MLSTNQELLRGEFHISNSLLVALGLFFSETQTWSKFLFKLKCFSKAGVSTLVYQSLKQLCNKMQLIYISETTVLE